MLPKRIGVLLAVAVMLSLLGAASVHAKKPPQSDKIPPDAVTELVPDWTATTHQSITLTWIATGDDGSEGQASTYDIRYALDGPMTEAKWDAEPLNRAWAFTDPYAVPHPDLVVYPAESGTPERVEFAGLAAGTTYYFGIKACDESGNCSPVAAADSETTLDPAPGEWAIDIVNDEVWTDEGRRKDVDVTDTGQIGVWYADEGSFYHSYRPAGSSWQHEVISGGRDDGCLAFAYSPGGVPWASTCANGPLQVLHKNDQDEWVYETVDVDGANAAVLDHIPGTEEPALAYKRPGTGSVYYAWREAQPGGAGTWHVDQVHSGDSDRNPQLAFSPTGGYPTVAFGTYTLGDYGVQFAENIAGSWTTEQVGEGRACQTASMVGLAYHPTGHYPVIAHMGSCNEGVLYTYRTPSGWSDPEYIDAADLSETGGYSYMYAGPMLVIGDEGTAYVAHGGGGYYQTFRVLANDGTGWRLAHGDAAIPLSSEPMITGDWAVNPVNGMPVFTYGADPVRIVERIPPAPGMSFGPTTGLLTTESGGQAVFVARLTTEPTADVTIALSSSDGTEGSVSPTSLTFTPSDWYSVQTVVVAGEDDTETDGDVAYTVEMAAQAGGDPNYSGLAAVLVPVTNLDNDGTSHVGDLDGDTSTSRSKWRAVISILVHDQNHDPVAGAAVTGSWIAGVSGTATCTTDVSGTCTVRSAWVKKTEVGSITFTVDGISHDLLAYVPAANHDPDGDSDGTTITVNKP